MQLRVRFVAAEVPTIRGGSGLDVERGRLEVVTSTWTFEGRVWTIVPVDPAESAPACWRKARTPNPDLVWRLVDVRE